MAILGWTNPAKSEFKVDEISRLVSKSWVAEHRKHTSNGAMTGQECTLSTATSEGDRLFVRKESGDVGRTATVLIAGERTKGSKTKEVSTARAKIDDGQPVPLLVYPNHVSTAEPGGVVHFYWPDNPDLLAMMVSGKTISFNIGPKDLRFDLVGFDQALASH
jgi:hypothetical protein